MLRLATDADVRGEIIRALLRRAPQLDLIRVQDALTEGVPDTEGLAWTIAEKRVLITNDRNTMIGLAYRLVAAGQLLPGIVVTTNEQPVGSAAEDLLLIVECMTTEELRDQVVVYLPL
jgi:hypothetical protein